MNPQNYFPATYFQQNYQQPMNVVPVVTQQMAQQYMPQQPQFIPQQQVQQQVTQTQPQQQPQMQEGFLRIHSEEEARSYPVAPNTSITFFDENSQYIYTKTMSASQLDRPKFEKYRLVKEDDSTVTADPQTQPTQNFVTREEFEKRIAEILDMKKQSTSQRKDKSES